MCKKQLIVMTRYPVNFIASFAQVFLIVFMIIVALSLFTSGEGGHGISSLFGGVIMYGFILFMFLSDTLWTIGYNIRWEQVQGTLESLYMSPASKFASLISRVSISLVWTGLNSLAALLVVTVVAGRLPFNNFWLAVYILVFSLSGTFGMGFAFAAFTMVAKQSANMAANALQFVFMGLCAMFFPFSVLPKTVLYVSRAIPLSYCVDAFRSTLMGYPEGYPELLPIIPEIVIVTAFGILMPVLGYGLYKLAEKRAKTRGTLGEY
ncbi:MAG: ABC transporter permease [Candidatus Methanofastidiosia archaeon]|jgi:ABC-2 type transport system permease protein